MNSFIRFYNQNKKDIIKFIIIIIVIIGVLQILNYIAKHQSNKNNEINNVSTNGITYNNINLETNESVLSGDKISEKNQNQIQIIDTFFSYCNENKIQEAYDLLTDECKKEMYSSVQTFKEEYYEKVLNGEKKNISIENWNESVYKVKITDDFLSSGKYSEENTIQDYITITKDENKEYKLNINKYIGRKEINKEKEYKNINIKVIEENEYIDYTIYTFEVTNNSQSAISLDSLKDLESIYIQDSKGVKYSAYTHEIATDQLLIDEGVKKQIKIKYYSQYSSSKKINKIVFSKLMLDYNVNKYSTLEIEI